MTGNTSPSDYSYPNIREIMESLMKATKPELTNITESSESAVRKNLEHLINEALNNTRIGLLFDHQRNMYNPENLPNTNVVGLLEPINKDLAIEYGKHSPIWNTTYPEITSAAKRLVHTPYAIVATNLFNAAGTALKAISKDLRELLNSDEINQEKIKEVGEKFVKIFKANYIPSTVAGYFGNLAGELLDAMIYKSYRALENFLGEIYSSVPSSYTEKTSINEDVKEALTYGYIK